MWHILPAKKTLPTLPVVAACASAAFAAGGPLPDLIVYGTPPICDAGLPPYGMVATVIACVGSASESFQIAGNLKHSPGENESPGLYVIRVPRRIGLTRKPGEACALPGDQVGIFIDQNSDGLLSASELSVAAAAKLTVSASERSIVRLDLDQSMADSDNDGLPDSWEAVRFGHLNWSGASSLNGAGVSNLVALAMGLDPVSPDVALMPRLIRESDGSWSYYFNLAASWNGISTKLMEADSPAGPWLPASGTPLDLGTWEGRTLFRHVLPRNPVRPRCFFRLDITSNPQSQP